jgi:hypothetical protein
MTVTRPEGARVSKASDLARSRGYRVDTHDGRIGSVLAVLPRAGCGLPGMLLVQTGLLSCRVTAVSFEEVESVDETRRLVQLAAPPVRAGVGYRVVARA